MIILNTVLHQLIVALKSKKSKFKVVISRHSKQLSNLRKQQKAKIAETKIDYIKNIVQNVSSHKLQQMNKLHYPVDLFIKFPLDLIKIEHIPS